MRRQLGRTLDVDHRVCLAPFITYLGWKRLGATRKLTVAGIAYKRGVLPFTADSLAPCEGETRGMTEILTDAGTDLSLRFTLSARTRAQCFFSANTRDEF